MQTASQPITAPARANYSRRESDDGYSDVVAVLNDRWRVILCRDRLQWILQAAEKSSRGHTWRGRRYLRTKNRLIELCGALAGDADPISLATIHALPERI